MFPDSFKEKSISFVVKNGCKDIQFVNEGARKSPLGLNKVKFDYRIKKSRRMELISFCCKIGRSYMWI